MNRIFLMAILIGAFVVDHAQALIPQIQVRDGGAIRIQMGNEFGFPVPNLKEQASNIESGAALKTDPDLEATLQKAERFKSDGNYRVATQLWQAVLRRSGDSLYSADGLTYFSLGLQVERILANLPPEGLTAYRVIADAEAKGILAQVKGPHDRIALNNVVRQYFISSQGDDAAFELGCIYLDEGDFIGAIRMFEKIAQQYPDPSVPLDQVYLRSALCLSYLGETELAKQRLDLAEEMIGETTQIVKVRRSLGSIAVSKPNTIAESDWHMRLGNNRRYGVMPAVPDETMESDLVSVWQYYFEPEKDRYNWADAKGYILTGKNATGEFANRTVDKLEEELIQDWEKFDWRPAGSLLFDRGRVYFKSAADMTVWNADRVAELIANPAEEASLIDAIQWRSVWRNSFQIDTTTQMLLEMKGHWGRPKPTGNKSPNASPDTTPEIQLFGDLVFQQMSICNGLLYSLEGKKFDDRNRIRSNKVNPRWNQAVRRTRTNYLTAYDAETGELQWTLPKQEDASSSEKDDPEKEESEWLEGGGFMSAPVGFGELVLVPVNQGGAITVYALDPKQRGKTVWKSFLCDEPESSAEPWSAINMSIEGSDLFVNCGMGAVFVLDPTTGLVRFAKRYDRVGSPDNNHRRRGWSINRLNFRGWSSDVIIPYGRQMICFHSDTNSIEALNRNTGQVIWTSEINPLGFEVDYLLGVYEDILYAAGTETIVAYDLQGEGRMVWGAEQMFDGKQSCGRGMLTPNGIYMPVENAIYHFPLPDENGQSGAVRRVQVKLGTDAPVGNLYSDGKQFWVHGANRLYVLGKSSN